MTARPDGCLDAACPEPGDDLRDLFVGKSDQVLGEDAHIEAGGGCGGTDEGT